MFCSNCGRKSDGDFCPYCGEPLKDYQEIKNNDDFGVKCVKCGNAMKIVNIDGEDWYVCDNCRIRYPVNQYSRYQEAELPKRKNNPILIVLSIIGVAAILLLLAMMLFGTGDDAPPSNNTSTNAVSQNSDSVIESESEPIAESEPVKSSEKEYKIGETWEVDGKFRVTVNSVEESSYRNSFDESNPGVVYCITYTYENIGIQDGLYVDMAYNQNVDSTGKMGSSYPGDYELYPQEAPVGASCQAEAWVAFDNSGTFKSYVEVYDEYYNEYDAIFVIEP